MQNNLDFDSCLKNEWNQRYEHYQLQLFRSNLKFVHFKPLQNGPFYVYFNRQLVENKRESQVQLTGKIELVMDFDESSFNFTEVDNNEILFFVNLEDEEIIPCSERNSKLEQEIEEESEYNFEHPLLINDAPICKYHCIIPPFFNEQLPQVLGGELVQLLLNIFCMTSNPSLRLGYNGIGAFSSVNHLHFQLLYADELIPDLKIFPVERFPKQKIFSCGLKSKDELQMYSNGVTISRVNGYPVNTIVLEPLNKPSNKQELADSYCSLSFVMQLIVERMLELKIAHNVMFADSGNTIYIYPRQIQLLHVHEHKMKPAWIELGGIAIVREKSFFETMTTDEFDNLLREECSISDDIFLSIIQGVESKLKLKFD